MTGRPYNPRYSGLEYLPDFLDKNIWDVIFYDTTIFDTFYTFQKRKMERNDHKKKNLVLLFFFCKKFTYHFLQQLTMIYLFNFLVIELKTTLKFLIQEKKTIKIFLSRNVWKCISSKTSRKHSSFNISLSRNVWKYTSSKTSRKHSRNRNQSYGGILISRLHLILPSVSPIIITRLFFLIFNGVSKIK